MRNFDIFQGKDGKWYFHIKGDNGEITSQSQGYSSNGNAWRGLRANHEIVSKMDPAFLLGNTNVEIEPRELQLVQADLEDAIATAIDDSMDVDWTSRDGARQVLREILTSDQDENGEDLLQLIIYLRANR